jgi:hypothetical protein
MRAKGREQGRFVALSGFRKMAGPPGGRYELLIVDGTGRPVSPLCEWYRLRKQPGPNGTRRTYLAFLQPFFAYLLTHGHAWNAPPEQVRRFVKAFLLDDVGCRVNRDTTLDGYQITLTSESPLCQSSMNVLLAAIRDFYAVMAEAGLYAYPNPMCSEMLQRWKREQRNLLPPRLPPPSSPFPPQAMASLRWRPLSKRVAFLGKILPSSLMGPCGVRLTRSCLCMNAAEKPMVACAWSMGRAFAIAVRVHCASSATGVEARQPSRARAAYSSIPWQWDQPRCSGGIGPNDASGGPV